MRLRTVLYTGFPPLAALVAGVWIVIRIQGLSESELQSWSKAEISRDSHDIYDIEAKDWLDFSESQGFVVAGERLFQMDLIRRKASGRLAELFGIGALQSDRRFAEQDWSGVADRAVEMLPENQRKSCEAYASGVNQFIASHEHRWGLEYLILRAKPEVWLCRDSILVIMSMIDSMTNFETDEVIATKWHTQLPETWWKWIYDQSHPWNVPLIENSSATNPNAATPIPPQATWLAPHQVTAQELATVPKSAEKAVNGSNSWAYRGNKGTWLANDPHIGYQVPQVWFALRFHTPSTGRVAGTTLPGLPGVLIGANEHIGWAITNGMEDVDDLLTDDSPILQSKERVIKVHNGADVTLTIEKTVHGPIVHREDYQNAKLVRQWIGFFPKFLEIPTQELASATDWQTFNDALDHLQSIPLNFTMIDRANNIGYRMTGVSIDRNVIGTIIQQAEKGAWEKFNPPSSRKRLFLSANSGNTYLGTANQRIWVDDQYHHWADDDRVARIRDLLSHHEDLTLEDMKNIQLDTHVEFHRLTIQWLLAHSDTSLFPANLLQKLSQWSGGAAEDPQSMTTAIQTIQLLRQVVAGRLLQKASDHSQLPSIRRMMWRSWFLRAYKDDRCFMALGLTPKDLATALSYTILKENQASPPTPYFELNTVSTQHPFVGRVPVLGSFFATQTPIQYGYANAIRAEQPTYGPSMRIIWDVEHPENSRWSFPIGQSGHIGSGHYNDFQEIWAKGESLSVF